MAETDGARRGSRWGRRLALAAGAAAVGAAGVTARRMLEAFGAESTGERLRRVHLSPQFHDGRFHNRKITSTLPPPGTMRDTVRDLVFGRQARHPVGTVPLVSPLVSPVEQGGDGMYVTWYGHSSAMVELDGARVLFDPVWGERVSPAAFAGPKRLHPVPVALADLPQVDAIVISHDHYDHLDLPSVRTLLRTQSAPFVVPLGVGAHLERWHVPAERIIELDWDERTELAGLTLVATPAQHFSGRLFKRDGTLWTSWTVIGPTRRAFYTGDSGYFPGYAEIGERFGPFDVTLVQIGAYAPAWPDIHMTPEEGVAAHVDVRGSLLVPVH